MSILPYDMINKIFGFLADISDSGWKMQIDSRGRVRLSLNPHFTDIHYVVAFKTEHRARYVKLCLKEWKNFDTIEYTIDALEQPFCHSPNKREIHNFIGFITDNRCYSYVDPNTNKELIAYTESRKYYNHENIYYQTGYVYDISNLQNLVPNIPIYVISGYGADEQPNTVRFDISPYIFEWFMNREGDYEAADALMDMANGEQEQEEEATDEYFEDTPLQMYM